MIELKLKEREIARLTELARVLIPATDRMPAADGVADFDALLRTAVKASAVTAAELRSALGALPATLDWDGTRAFAAAEPARFELLAQLVTGAYLMARPVLERLGFPLETDRRHPAGPEEFLEEYETGVLEPVITRGQRWRDPRR